MAEPKLRFKNAEGTAYQPLHNATMGDYYTERNEHGGEDLPVLTVSIHSGVSDGELDEAELGKRVKRSVDLTLYKRAEAGDLVFNMMRAWQGAVGSVKTTGMVSPAYIVAKPNSDIDPLFMDYYVQTKSIINRFNRLSYGALDFRKRLYWDSFTATEVNIPSIEEQQKIADFLYSVDDVITVSEKEVANLETQKKAVMKKIFSQEVRFKRADGSDFPEWEKQTLGNLAEFSKGQGYTKSDLSETGSPIILYGRLYTKYQTVISKVDTFAEMKPRSVLSKKGDVIVPASGETAEDISVAAVVDVDGIILGGDLNIIHPCNAILPDYLAYALTFGTPHQEMAKRAQGKSIVHLHNDDLKSAVIVYPCLEEQHLIADFLSDFDEAILAAKKELELWKELKKGLLQQMFV